MLIDHHDFPYSAVVPWPCPEMNHVVDWIYGVESIESWLNTNVGHHYQHWAWNDSQASSKIGVAFRYDRDRCLFLLTWDR